MSDLSEELEAEAQEEAQEEKFANKGVRWLLALASFFLVMGWEVIRRLYFSS